MERKFTVLRVVSTIFKVLGVLVLILGILGACLMIAGGAMSGSSLGGAGSELNNQLGLGAGGAIAGAIAGVGVLFITLLYFLLLYAFGDIITLLIALEENTRITAERIVQAPLAPLQPVRPVNEIPAPPPASQLPPAP